MGSVDILIVFLVVLFVFFITILTIVCGFSLYIEGTVPKKPTPPPNPPKKTCHFCL